MRTMQEQAERASIALQTLLAAQDGGDAARVASRNVAAEIRLLAGLDFHRRNGIVNVKESKGKVSASLLPAIAAKLPPDSTEDGPKRTEHEHKVLLQARSRWSEAITTLRTSGITPMVAMGLTVQDWTALVKQYRKSVADAKPPTLAEVWKDARKLSDSDKRLLIIAIESGELQTVAEVENYFG